ncbi:MAG TPA: ABC transporter substrate-binding protein [Natronosporangium sp.]
MSKYARRRVPVLGVVTLLLAMVAACSGNQSSSDSVTLRLDFLPSGYHAPFVWAEQSGIYADSDVDLTVVDGTGSAVTAQRVASGAEAYGFVDMGTAMQLIDQGAPIRAISVIVQRSPLSLLSLTSSGIDEPADLVGKRIGQVGDGANAAMLPVFLRAAGVPVDGVQPVNVPGPSLPQAVVDGDVDAMIGILNFHLAILEHELGADISRLDIADYGVNVLSFALITNETEIEQNPDRVRSVVSATVEAWTSVVADPEPALAALQEAYPDLNPEVARDQLATTITLLHTPATEGMPIGTTVDEDVLASEQALVDAGLLDEVTGEVDRYLWRG